MDSNIKEKEDELISEGCDSYLDALTAIREFQKIILGKSRNVLKGKLEAFKKAMNIDEEIKITDHISPNLHSNDVGEWGCIAVTFKTESMEWYFGLYLYKDDLNVSEVFVTLYPNNNSFKKDFLKKFEKNNFYEDEDEDHSNINLSALIKKEDIDSFEEKLEVLIDKWIYVWKEVGGIEKLPKKA